MKPNYTNVDQLRNQLETKAIEDARGKEKDYYQNFGINTTVKSSIIWDHMKYIEKLNYHLMSTAENEGVKIKPLDESYIFQNELTW